MKINHLPFDDLQYLDFLEQKNKTKNLRSEAIVDTVRPVITIKIMQGINPRCTGAGENFVFSATGFNWGQSGTVEWFVNNTSVGNGFSFLGSNYENGTEIQAKVTSTLPCAKPKIASSNIIKIEVLNSLEAAVGLVVIAGNNPECSGVTSNITLQAVPVNGGSNPVFSWEINGTFVGSIVGSNYTFSDSRPVRVRMISSGTSSNCVSAATDTIFSNRFTRSSSSTINQLTTNPVELKLVSITNDFCQQALYNFEATAFRAGQNPTFRWFKNNELISNANGRNLSTTLDNTGDEIQVRVSSSLSCINITTSSSNVFAKVDTLISLPFFEDFSTYNGSPDKNKWIKNGGTLISNTYFNNPPTKGLAIFDGLKFNGSPYDSINITNRGLADNLTSLPLDLSFYQNSDNLYLHFFWMYRGLGDAPELTQGDKLTLSFKDNTGNYIEVWSAVPNTQPDVFLHASVPITNLANINYLFRGFQFKFQSSGRLSGQYDVWAVDYVVLQKNSSPKIFNYLDQAFYKQNFKLLTNIQYYSDQAFSRQPLSVLKNYQSMPYKHFAVDKINQLNTITTSVNNLDSSQNNNATSVYLEDAFDNSRLGRLDTLTLVLPGLTQNQLVTVNSNASFFPAVAPRNPYELKTVFKIIGNNDNPILGIPFSVNNSISGLTRFDNYYAYDDGSAEYIISNNAKNEHNVIKFSLPPTVVDTLKEIAFQFNKSNTQLIGQSFRIVVFKSLPRNGYILNGPEVLYNKIAPIRYAPRVNGFTPFRLEKPIPLSGDFFVGYTQISDGNIVVGFDKNTDCSSNTFYTVGGDWDTLSVESPEAKGSMMIRPVFGFYNFEVTSVENPKTETKKELFVFPNPIINGELTVENAEIDENLSIFNMQGSVVYSQIVSSENFKINLTLNKGIYVLKVGTKYKKIVFDE